MATINKPKNILSLPLSSFRLISRNQKNNRIIVEINLQALKKINEPETLDELISQSRFDFATGNFQSFSNAADLVADLNS